jgi:hypothetical protein
MKNIIQISIFIILMAQFVSCDRDGYFANIDTISVNPPSVCIVVHTTEIISGTATVVKQNGATVNVYKVNADGTHEAVPKFTKTTDNNGYAKLNNTEMLQIFPENTNAKPTDSRGGKLYIEASNTGKLGNNTSPNINMTDGETFIWVEIK